MARAVDRSPEERFRMGRRLFWAGALFEFAGCIALLFLLRWPQNIIVALIAAVMLTSYNLVFWRTLKKQATEQSDDSPPSRL